MTGIPESYQDLFDKKALAFLATVQPDGSPQLTPVWCDFDGQHVRINSARGRRKDKNIRNMPRVALSLVDPDNPYRYLEVRGTVVEITEEGADAHIQSLSMKYLGKSHRALEPGEVRVIYKIQPEHVTHMG